MTKSGDVLILGAVRRNRKWAAKTAVVTMNAVIAAAIVQTAVVVRDNPGLNRIELDRHRVPMTFSRDDLGDGTSCGVPVGAMTIPWRTNPDLVENPKLVVDTEDFWVIGQDVQTHALFASKRAPIEQLARFYRLDPATGLSAAMSL